MIDRLVRIMRTARDREGGAALVTVLLFMVIVLILITSVLAVTGNEIRISGLHRDSVRAFELAQAGLQEGVRRIQSGRQFQVDGDGTDECPKGFTPSITLGANEALEVGVCPTALLGFGATVYEVQADARVGLAVRRLSVTVRAIVNNVPPEIVLSRDFGQGGSSSLAEGDNFTETYSIYQTYPDADQHSFAGWFIWDDAGTRATDACYAWPCADGLNLYPGSRRLWNDTGTEMDDAGTCSGNIPNGSRRADHPTGGTETGGTALCGYDTDPELTTYVLRSGNSDLTGGGTFNKQLAVGADAAGTGTITVPDPGSASGYAFTDASTPGASGRTGSIAIVVKVDTCSGCGNKITLSVKAARVSAVGAMQQQTDATNCPATGCSQTVSSGTTYIFPLYNVNLGTWTATDRLRIEYSFTHAGGGGSKDVVLETGTTSEFVSAPFGTEQAKTDAHTSGLPYKYLSRTVLDETGASVDLYFKYVRLDDWFETYYEFVESGSDPGWNKRDGSSGCTAICLVGTDVEPDLANNPQFIAIPGFPSDEFIQSQIDQAPAGNTMTGGGTITSGSSIDFGCPPVGLPDPHTPGCNGTEGDYQFVALLDGDYHVNSNINGFGTMVVDGNLEVNGTVAWVGTIYVTGNLSGNGTVVVTGGIVTKSTTDFSGNLEVRTGEDTGDLTVSNDITVTIGSMWER